MCVCKDTKILWNVTITSFQKNINVENVFKKKKKPDTVVPWRGKRTSWRFKNLTPVWENKRSNSLQLLIFSLLLLYQSFVFWFVFAFLLFCLSSILTKRWTAIHLLFALWPLLTSAHWDLCSSCPCLQDSPIFPACINTSEWLSLLRWGTWLTSCIFPSLSPSPSMCLSCSALNLCLHHAYPILSFTYSFKWISKHILTLLMFFSLHR